MPYSSITVLYIPRVNRNHMGHGEYVKRVFEHQGFAVLKSVEFFEHDIPNASFGYAIIKVQFWIPGIVSKNFQDRLQDSSKETRIVFSDPSYWIVLPYSEKQKVIKIPPPPRTSSSLSIQNLIAKVHTQPNKPTQQHQQPNQQHQQPNTNCICGCGGIESDCSSHILYNQFVDNIWAPFGSSKSTTVEHQQHQQHQRLGNCRNSWTSMANMEDNFRFYDMPLGFDASSY